MEIPREQLLKLIELAEDAIQVRDEEYSNDPTDEERELMLSLYRLVGKDVPEYFRRIFGWKIDSEVEPDERED